jgi:hypothetical protein
MHFKSANAFARQEKSPLLSEYPGFKEAAEGNHSK